MPQAVNPSAPAESPLGGAAPGLKVATILSRLGNQLGYQITNARFVAAATEWMQDILLEIQLKDPLMRRTLVMDAPFILEAGTDVYDVRQAPFGWSNCYAVNSIKFPSLQSRVIETVTPEQYRYRATVSADSGDPIFVVKLDQLRIRIVPPPNTALAGVGDYQQDIPTLNGPDDRVDWPKAWDIVLLEGCMYRGFKWRSEQEVGVWKAQYQIFRDKISELKTTEAVTTRAPGKAVVVRSRRGSVIPHDNSADIRWRR